MPVRVGQASGQARSAPVRRRQRTLDINDAKFIAQPVFKASDPSKHVFTAHNIAGVEIVEGFASVMKRVQSIELPLA
jgi:hypothetical protein